MVLKELILTSMDSFGDFEVNGNTLNKSLYLELADKEVKSYYLDTNKDGQAYMVVTLEDY